MPSSPLQLVRNLIKNEGSEAGPEMLLEQKTICGSLRVKSITFRPFLNHPTPIFMKF